MNEFEKARQFGLIDIPTGQQCFRVFTDRYDSVMIQTFGYPVKAIWQGNQIIVEMQSGEVFVYNSLSPSGYYRVSR